MQPQTSATQRAWHWRDCQTDRLDRYPTQPPQQLYEGAAYHDPRSGCVYVWNGCEWVCIPTD